MKLYLFYDHSQRLILRSSSFLQYIFFSKIRKLNEVDEKKIIANQKNISANVFGDDSDDEEDNVEI